MKILLAVSESKTAGSWLRTVDLAQSLKKHAEVALVPAFPFALPWRLHLLLTLPYYMVKILFSDADVIIGNKPHFNIALPLLFAKYFQKKR